MVFDSNFVVKPKLGLMHVVLKRVFPQLPCQ